MKKALLLAVIGLIASATVVLAANKEGQFSLSPVIGGYTFDDRQHLDTNPVYGLRAGYNFTKHLGIEALFDYVNTESRTNNKDISVFRYGGEFLYHFFPDNAFVPYVAAGFGGLRFNSNAVDSKNIGVFDYGIGAKYFITDSFALRADVRHLITTAHARHNVEYTIGAYIPFGGVDKVAKPVEAPPAEDVPPPPTAKLTAVPNLIKNGQESTLSWTSKNASKCDIEPGIGPVDLQGSKVVTPSSSTTYQLNCSAHFIRVGSVATVDVVAPAPVEVVKPKPAPIAERFCKPTVLKINFDTDKSDIKPIYAGELKAVGDFLKEFPNAKGEISGHTDNIASKSYNEKLSQRRAASVKKYLVDKFGISPDRIIAKGYGLTKPVATNKTKEGRAKNRRIEANFDCK
jgi:OOP family OmpA-OmpF porin